MPRLFVGVVVALAIGFLAAGGLQAGGRPAGGPGTHGPRRDKVRRRPAPWRRPGGRRWLTRHRQGGLGQSHRPSRSRDDVDPYDNGSYRPDPDEAAYREVDTPPNDD
jgi:hypothetical protein